MNYVVTSEIVNLNLNFFGSEAAPIKKLMGVASNTSHPYKSYL
jgi:hypothetical protein